VARITVSRQDGGNPGIAWICFTTSKYGRTNFGVSRMGVKGPWKAPLGAL
jgi:hypothetical protein